MKPIDPLPPVNRIKDFVAPPIPIRAAKDEDEDEDEDECGGPGCAGEAYDPRAHIVGKPSSNDDTDDDDADDENTFIGSGDDDDDDDDDGDDDDDDDEADSEATPEDYLRTKVCLALEENSFLTFGKVIVHEDPHDEDKLLVTMQLDKFADDEEMPNLEGGEMREVSVVLLFEGGGVTEPKKRIVQLDQLSKLFDDKNWKKSSSD